MTPEQLKVYYQQLYKQHGDTPASVQHVSRSAQNVRFKIFHEFIDNQSSVLDLGCGLADFLVYLRQNNHQGHYLGCDFVTEFISRNNQVFMEDELSKFYELNLLEADFPQGYDVVAMSGIFNNVLTCNEVFLMKTLEKAFAVANHTVIFNALSSYVEYQDDTLFYVDPIKLFHHVKSHLTPFVQLKHDYVTKPDGFPYEFTMVLKKVGDLP